MFKFYFLNKKMVLEERLKLLKQLIKEQEIYKMNSLNQNIENVNLNEELNIEQKPIIDELKNIEQNLSNIENKININNIPSIKENESVVNYIQPFILKNIEINNILPKSLKPEFKLKNYHNKEFQTIKFKNNIFVLFEVENEKYIGHEASEKKYKYTDNLDLLIRGYGNENMNEEDVNNYSKLIDTFGGNKTNKYFKSIFKREGRGLNNINSSNFYEAKLNPISLFIELKKYISAKKAGNNNVDDKIFFILEQLLKRKLITNEYYQKIKKNYL